MHKMCTNSFSTKMKDEKEEWKNIKNCQSLNKVWIHNISISSQSKKFWAYEKIGAKSWRNGTKTFFELSL